jgi:hypothetical protein
LAKEKQSFIVEKQFFPAIGALPRHCEKVFLSTQSRFRVFFFVNVHPISTLKAYLLILLGMLLDQLNPATLNIGDLV